MSDLNLAINISAIDSASNIIRNVGKAVSDMASGDFAGAAKIAATAAIGFTAASVKMAGDFQTSMTQLVTGAGESKSAIGQVSQGILDMAVQTGTSTQQLSAGMYMIESAGFHGAQGLQVLQAAAEGAKVGNADLGTVANAVTTILTDYHLSAGQATAATNALITTVADGKTHMQDLSGAMGAVLPLASSVGISFGQVGGAIATMTNAGMSAQHASQNLANSIRSLSAPSSTATKSMASVGLTAQQLKDTLTNQGLPAALQLIEDHVGKKFPAGSVDAVTAFKNIMGGATGYNVALMLGGKNMQTFEGNVKSITGAMNAGGNAVQGWSDVQDTFNFKMAQAQQAVNVLMIEFGTTLLPVLGKALDIFTALVSGQGLGGFGPIMQNVSGMLGIMGHNWQDLANATKPFMADLRQFGALLGQLLPGFVSQALRFLDLLQLAFIAIAKGAATIAGPWLLYVGQVLKGIQIAIEPVLNAIEGQFIPALNHIVGVIAPIIAAFFKWAAASGIIPVAFSLIGNAVGIVITIFSKLIDIGAGIIGFFEHNRTAMDALLSVLGMIALQIGSILIPALIGMGVTIFTEVIPGFIAWAIQAAIAGISTLISFWPIIAAAALVAAAIFIVIEVIQHWGAIAGWLKSAWSAVASFFTSLWNGIVAGLKAAWNAIVSVVKVGAMLLLGAILGPFIAIGALFVWLYNHNYYFKNLVDAIVNFVKAGLAWLTAQWQGFTAWLGFLWDSIVGIATTAWNNVTNAVKVAVNIVIGWLTSAWNTEIRGLTVIWNMLSGAARAAWNAVASVFQAAWGMVSGPLTSFWNSIVNTVNGWANQFTQFGKNLIQGFINGIIGMIGNVGHAAQQIMGKVAGFLGFHSPAKEGPGAELDLWPKNMVASYAKGLSAGVPQIQAAMNLLVKPLAVLGSPAAAGTSAPVAAPAASGGGATVININISNPLRSRKDVQDLAEQVHQEISRKLRNSGNLTTWTSGGRA